LVPDYSAPTSRAFSVRNSSKDCRMICQPPETPSAAVDLLLGVLLACEFLGRMLAHRHPMHHLDNGAALVDLAVIASLLVSALGANLGFLRVLRTARLLRSYKCSDASRSCPRGSAATRR